jgi:coproporphyrinogen III oxidase-like Fe-S oxidoreductase
MGLENFKRIFNALFTYLKKENIKEITLEIFPSKFDKELFDYLKDYITRISIGIQCFNDKTLEKFNRNAKIVEMIDFLKKLKDYPFIKNFDIIYGLYLDNLEDYEKEIITLLRFNPENITFQPLHNNLKLKQADPIFFQDYVRRLDWLNKKAREIFRKKGYVQYTAEDFYKKGKSKFQYQLNLLSNQDILGIGINTFSFINNQYFFCLGKDKYNSFKLNSYQSFLHELSFKSRLLNLNLKELDKNYNINYKIFSSDSLKYLLEERLISLEGDIIKITKKGLPYVDFISQMLMLNNLDYKINRT